MKLILLALLSLFQPNEIHLFYSPDCEHCVEALENLKVLGTPVVLHDVTKPGEYELLDSVEMLMDTTGSLPAIFYRGKVFYGSDADSVATPVLHVFLKPGCKECERTYQIVRALKNRYPFIKVKEYDSERPENRFLLERFDAAVGVPEKERLIAPAIFVGDTGFIGEHVRLKDVEDRLRTHPIWTLKLPPVSEARKSVLERFKKFGVLTVILAGLADGINPCAFATLVFFIAYLLFIGRSKRKITLMSVSFIAGVFIAYFSIGLGAYQLLEALHRVSILKVIINLLFGTASLVFAFLSARDAYLCKKGRSREMLLQLSDPVKRKIHSDIKKFTSTGGVIIGSFLAGIFISLLELACTGQVYLPTIALVASMSKSNFRALSLLFLYNLMFILPLVIIAVASVGFGAEYIRKKLEKETYSFKIILAVIFALIGVVLLSFTLPGLGL